MGSFLRIPEVKTYESREEKRAVSLQDKRIERREDEALW